MDARLLRIEDAVLETLVGKFNDITDLGERKEIVKATVKQIDGTLSDDEIEVLFNDMNDIGIVSKLIYDEDIEDIMINNTSNMFAFNSARRACGCQAGLQVREQGPAV
jgi:Flp pilus assembly CpaF family ATPase